MAALFSLIKLGSPLCGCSPNVSFLPFLLKHGVKFFSLMASWPGMFRQGCWAWTPLACWTLPPMDSLAQSNSHSKLSLFPRKFSFPLYAFQCHIWLSHSDNNRYCQPSYCFSKAFPFEECAGYFYRLFFHISNDKSEPRATPWFLFSRVYYYIYSSL